MNEKRKLFHALIFPALFVVLMWVSYALFHAFDLDMALIGISPLKGIGLIGILGSPFAHGGIDHIASNTASFLILATILFYFYRLLAYKVFFLNWLISGVLLWIGGRDSVHIGASGLVYGLAFFLFFSGILRRDKALRAVSLIVIFLYGSMIWGMMPQGGNISWEGHLFGAFSGFMLAWYYRKNPVDFIPEKDGSSVSVTWGQGYDLIYEYEEEEEHED